LGRIAAARFIARFKLSIALLTMILEMQLSLNHTEADCGWPIRTLPNGKCVWPVNRPERRTT
jgi:hypothetical protein